MCVFVGSFGIRNWVVRREELMGDVGGVDVDGSDIC